MGSTINKSFIVMGLGFVFIWLLGGCSSSSQDSKHNMIPTIANEVKTYTSSSCPHAYKEKTEIMVDDIPQPYSSYKKNIIEQLNKGRSALDSDPNIINKLANSIPTHKDFFCNKIQESEVDLFCVERLLENSQLYNKHIIEFKATMKRSNNAKDYFSAKKEFLLKILTEN